MINRDYIGKAIEHLGEGLAPKCEESWLGAYGDDWIDKVVSKFRTPRPVQSHNDVSFLLGGLKVTWQEVFSSRFSPSVRSLVFEAAEARNKWAHQESFSSDDTIRALDSMERLLEAFGVAEKQEAIRALRKDLMRKVTEEETRSVYRKQASKSTKGTPAAGLMPWRDVVAPHADVRSPDHFYQAEFAADLFEVYQGRAEDEYSDPHLFFERTFLTRGLEDLLLGAARRLSGKGGDPVIELQTNFGGGKTHSMIALYHLASGVPTTELMGISDLLEAEGIGLPDNIKRAVLVGHKISPATAEEVEEGVKLHTLWGQLAYQLGGKDGYELLRKDDEAGVNPGASLTTLFEKCGPAIVLIDEWVAYARQLPGRNSEREPLAGGDFDTQFTFAQALTDAAAAISNVVLLITIPASDIETGGERGRTALERLKNVVARTASEWQPATSEESFEIVRRRLFEGITPENGKVKDAIVRAFSEMYKKQANDFPSGVGEADYRKLMERSYPVHPELFNRLFKEWSALEKFQRTRGALRLMAVAISNLWQKGDQSLMLMSGNLPMDANPLVSELRKYLEDNWDAVIKADVDGENSLPLKLDQVYNHLGSLSAARRTARTIYMGSAPRNEGSRGVDKKEIMIGCIQPGEKPGPFNDALRHLSSEATHLYVDGEQYWYSPIANITRLARDRAESNYNDMDADDEVKRRLRIQKNFGSFSSVQIFAEGPGDVPDDDEAVRLVILSPRVTHSRNDEFSTAVKLADEILKQREAGPRTHRNLLVFVAASTDRLSELHSVARQFLAWKSINEEELDSEHQRKQAQTKEAEMSQQVDSLIEETFIHVLTPRQKAGEAEIIWDMTVARARGEIAERVSKKLESEEKLISQYSGIRVRMDLEKFKLWGQSNGTTDNRQAILLGDLWKYYASLPYLPRLASANTLLGAINQGAASMSWAQETFGYASGYDVSSDTWVEVAAGENISATLRGYVLHSDLVSEYLEKIKVEQEGQGNGDGEKTNSEDTHGETVEGVVEDVAHEKRFYAKFNLDRVRGVKEVGDILENIVHHLDGETELTLEIESKNPAGYSDDVQRTVKENAATLKAEIADFE